MSLLTMFLVATPALAAQAPTVCEAQWRDAARNRMVPVRIRMPSGGGKVPVILFSHGLGGSLDAGTIWGRAWAQDGFAVIHLQHAGSDSGIIAPGRLRRAMSAEQVRARALDVRFVLDELGRRKHEGACDLARIDLGHVGMSGHSYGAQTTLTVAGTTNPLVGRGMADPRIDAAIAFNPQPAAQQGDRATFGSITIPFFSITGTRDEVPQLTNVTAKDRERPFRAMAPGNKYLLVMDGADHAAFGGQERIRLQGGPPPPHVRDVVTEASLNFWRAMLRNDGQAKRMLDGMGSLLPSKDRFERR